MYVYCLEERLTLTANHVTSRDTFSDAVGKRSTICVEWPKRIADRTNKTRIWCCCSGQWIEVYLSIVRWMIFVASSNGGGVNIRNLIEFKPHTHTHATMSWTLWFFLSVSLMLRKICGLGMFVCLWLGPLCLLWLASHSLTHSLSLSLSILYIAYITSIRFHCLLLMASCT